MNNNNNSNNQAQQQHQQQAAGAPPPNGNVLLISRPPSPIEFAPLDINAATSPPPIGEPGTSLAAWAAPYSLLHAEGATHTSAPQQEEEQQQQQIVAPPATTATGPLMTPTVISNWNNFYFYDMYRCRDDEEQDPTEGSYMAMVSIACFPSRHTIHHFLTPFSTPDTTSPPGRHHGKHLCPSRPAPPSPNAKRGSTSPW